MKSVDDLRFTHPPTPIDLEKLDRTLFRIQTCSGGNYALILLVIGRSAIAASFGVTFAF